VAVSGSRPVYLVCNGLGQVYNLANEVPHFATEVVCFYKRSKFQDFQVPIASY